MKQHTFNSLIKMSGVLCFIAMSLSFSTTSNAQCGGSLDAMAAAALSAQSKSRSEFVSILAPRDQTHVLLTGDSQDDLNPSVVGLWRVQFNITPPEGPPVTIQDAFQIWNTGGTEVHNPNMDPRGGSVCLGAWARNGNEYKLVHRVWNHATDGTFLGTINLTETVRVVNRGHQQTGSFTLEFFDPAGNPMPPVRLDGAVAAERITPE